MTNTYLALLRGINVSGRNIIKMAELREMMTVLGFPDSTTYIQSGNIIFKCRETDRKELEQILKSGILARFGHNVPVLVLRAAELRTSLTECPYTDDGTSKPVAVYISYMSDIPRENAAPAFVKAGSATEQWMIKDRFFYLSCPSGYSKTKLTNEFIEKSLGIQSTTRNIRTVRKLAALADE